MTSLRQHMLEDMQIRNLAVNTQESYVQQVSLFARYFNQSPERLGPEQIRAYQVYLTNERKLATGSILIAISALRFPTGNRLLVVIDNLNIRRTGGAFWPFEANTPLVVDADAVLAFPAAVKGLEPVSRRKSGGVGEGVFDTNTSDHLSRV